MKTFRFGLVAATLAAMLLPSQASAAALFRSVLSGAQEVGPTGLPVGGSGTFRLRGAGTPAPSLAFDLLFDSAYNFETFGLAGTGARRVIGLHIHAAPRGQNGSVIYGLLGPNSDDDNDLALALTQDGSARITGEWDADEGAGALTFSDIVSDFAEARPGDEVPFYLNLHTQEFPSGAIRGQLTAVPLPPGLPLLAGAVGLLALRRRRRAQVRG